MASGAVTSGLLRIPAASPALAAGAFHSHRALGIVTVALALFFLRRSAGPRAWLAVGLVSAAPMVGWLAARSFAPRTAALHAAVAAVAAAALAGAALSRETAGGAIAALPGAARRGTAWPAHWARIGLGVMTVQVAIGALLRHQQIDLAWHLLAAGIATILVLVPAIAVGQEQAPTAAERRVARWAIASLVTQVSLGASVYLMILVGPPSVWLWLAATVLHVVFGSVSLVASAALARVLGARLVNDR